MTFVESKINFSPRVLSWGNWSLLLGITMRRDLLFSFIPCLFFLFALFLTISSISSSNFDLKIDSIRLATRWFSEDVQNLSACSCGSHWQLFIPAGCDRVTFLYNSAFVVRSWKCSLNRVAFRESSSRSVNSSRPVLVSFHANRHGNMSQK